MKILFVCLGNICRSPLAEAIFNHQVVEKQLQSHFQADSCGTGNYHIGDPPDSRTVRNALKNGISIRHIGRQFGSQDFGSFDLILTMDRSNRDNLIQLQGSGTYKDKIKLIRMFDSIKVGADVPDPYHGSEKDFQEVFDILERSVRGLVESLEAQIKAN